MSLHIIKLCVGADAVEDLALWQARRLQPSDVAGQKATTFHDTRMFPKRRDELLDGGSLYWVIKNLTLVRQRIVSLDEVYDAEGRSMCRFQLDTELVRTEPVGRRPFQGWRYLNDEDAPADVSSTSAAVAPELMTKLKDALAW